MSNTRGGAKQTAVITQQKRLQPLKWKIMRIMKDRKTFDLLLHGEQKQNTKWHICHNYSMSKVKAGIEKQTFVL